MQKGLEEGVLYDLIHLSGITQLVIGDSRRPSLLPIDDAAESLRRLFPLTAGQQTLDFGGELGLGSNPIGDCGALG